MWCSVLLYFDYFFHAIQVMVKWYEPFDLCKSTMTRKWLLLRAVTFEKILILIASLFVFFWTDAQLACKSRACVWTVGHQSIRAVIIIRSAMPRDFSTTQRKRPSQLLLCWGESSWSQRKCHKAPTVCRVSPRPSRHSDSHTGAQRELSLLR